MKKNIKPCPWENSPLMKPVNQEYSIDKFKKRSESSGRESTSVFLDVKHKAWIAAKRLNFSALVRDYLDSLMAEDAKKKGKS